MKKRFIWGLLIFIIGIILLLTSFFQIWTLIYGIPLFVIGLIIMLNRDEDKIEQINYVGGKK